jgi:endonuclease/exonuclease/phosphatase family metal-dependent hydrolase
MHWSLYVPRCSGGFLVALLLLAQPRVLADTTVRVVSANLTSGNFSKYESPGLRILQGLKADIVAIQEFNYSNNTPADLRAMVDSTFGTDFHYFRETGYSIPNGIISRYPILVSGSWDDPAVPDRGFAWARIQLPETNELYVVSVHLYSSGTAADRNNEAIEIKNQIQANFPAGAWIVVAGDFNTSSRDEPAIATFTTFLSDSPIPTDAESGGDPDTNSTRGSPYDYVLPSFSFRGALIPVVFPSRTFSNGLVFDSRVYLPLSDVPPVVSDDSGALNMQHMAVVKDFRIGTNQLRPSILTQPQSQTAVQGSDVAFSVAASGAQPLSYQWLFSSKEIPGASFTSYTRTNAQAADAGNYSVVVTNSYGSATSLVAVLTFSSSPSGDFARWDFNSTNPDGTPTTGTLNPALGSGTASYVGGVTGTFATGSLADTNADNSGWNTTAYPMQGTGNKTAGVRFNVSTLGWQDVSIRWDQRASNTGSKYARLQYTTNGTTFVDFPTTISLTTAEVFEAKTIYLGNVPGANNNSNFAFRIVAEFESSAANTLNSNYVAAGTSYGTGGTIRFDRVTISGAQISSNVSPAPASLSAPVYNAGQFRFSLQGSSGSNYVVQISTNLGKSNWISLTTNSAPFSVVDTNAGVFLQRFYRAVAVP